MNKKLDWTAPIFVNLQVDPRKDEKREAGVPPPIKFCVDRVENKYIPDPLANTNM